MTEGAKEMADYFQAIMEECRRRYPEVAKAMELFEAADKAYQVTVETMYATESRPASRTLTTTGEGAGYGDLRANY